MMTLDAKLYLSLISPFQKQAGISLHNRAFLTVTHHIMTPCTHKKSKGEDMAPHEMKASGRARTSSK